MDRVDQLNALNECDALEKCDALDKCEALNKCDAQDKCNAPDKCVAHLSKYSLPMVPCDVRAATAIFVTIDQSSRSSGKWREDCGDLRLCGIELEEK